MKRFFIALVCMVSLLLLSSVSVALASDWQYTTLSDGTIELVKYTGIDKLWPSWELTIPDTIDGKRVTSIGDYACAGLNISSVTFPDTITHMGNNPFRNCSSLEDFFVSKKHPYVAAIDHVLFTKPDKRLVFYPISRQETTYTIPQGIRIIGESAFYGDTNSYSQVKLTSIVIPDSVVSIENNAFYLCGSLQSISIPSSVTSIGDSAFYACKQLKTVTCAEGLVSIGYYTFQDCSSLESISLPGSLENIAGNPFVGCTRLSSINVSNSPYLSVRNNVLFSDPDKRLICYPRGLSANNYSIPEGIQIIGDSAFIGNNRLTSIQFPNSLFSISANAFKGCTGISTINLPEGIYSIGDRAFYGCSSLIEIILPEGLDSIGAYALASCSLLRSVTLPDSLSFIGENAFYGNDMKVYVDEHTVGEQYAMDNKITFEYPGELDWLLN